MLKIKYFFQQSWLLISASFCFGLLIAAANATWQERILQNEEDKFNNLARQMLPDANSFEIALENFDVDTGKGKEKATTIKKALTADGTCIGWAFKCEGSGFANKIKLVLVTDAGFEKIRGFGVLSSYETPKIGDKIKFPEFRNQFINAPAMEFMLVKTGDRKKIDSEIVAISGATISSQAVIDMINVFLLQVKAQMQAEGLISDGQ